ncbi:hypothetical protein TNCV_1469941 [Trichonephila clavipes]|nr:hypothetical protein TNCV_1469941 [Trichonephila clavipes]
MPTTVINDIENLIELNGTIHIFAEDVGLPELKRMLYGKEKEEMCALNSGKNAPLSSKELESSSSNKTSKGKILKIKAKDENKIKQEDVNRINTDEEKIKQHVTIIKNDS